MEAPEGSGEGLGRCASGEALAQRNCVLFCFQKKKGWVYVGSAEFCHLTCVTLETSKCQHILSDWEPGDLLALDFQTLVPPFPTLVPLEVF